MPDAEFTMPRSRLKSMTSPRTISELVSRYSQYKEDKLKHESLYPWADRFVMGYPLPSWQRELVWTDEQKVRFITSIWTENDLGTYLINDVPELFYEDEQGVVRSLPFADCLLDGQQRLSAIQAYVDDQIAVPDAQGVPRYYSELPVREGRYFRNRVFAASQINSQDERELREIYDLRAFGGVAHKPNERAISPVEAKPVLRIGYHVSPIENLDNILEKGLIPAIGPRSELLGESVPAIYLFATRQALEDALMNWLGDQFDVDTTLLIFEVDLIGLQVKQQEGCEWEIVALEPVESKRILSAYTEDWLSTSKQSKKQMKSPRF